MNFNYSVLDCETTQFTDATDYRASTPDVTSGLNRSA